MEGDEMIRILGGAPHIKTTTMIYADYAPSDQDPQLIERAFAGNPLGHRSERFGDLVRAAASWP